MAGPSEAPQKNWGHKILFIGLPLLFLFIGFFGIQIWMVWDEKNTVKPDKPIAAKVLASTIKADLAKITESGDVPLSVSKETPATPPKTSAIGEQAITSEIPGMEYYRIQVGSFADPEGAEKLKKKLHEMKYGSVVVKNDDQSKVIAMTFFSREQAEAVKVEMEEKGVSGYPEKIVVPPTMTMLKADSIRLQTFMDGSLIEIPEMLRELCDYYYIFESQGMDLEAHQKVVLKQISQLSDMKTSIENIQVNKEDQALQTQLNAYLTEYMQYLEKAGKTKTMDRKTLWPGLVNRIEAFGQLNAGNTVN